VESLESDELPVYQSSVKELETEIRAPDYGDFVSPYEFTGSDAAYSGPYFPDSFLLNLSEPDGFSICFWSMAISGTQRTQTVSLLDFGSPSAFARVS
jgi:hypothetical protein